MLKIIMNKLAMQNAGWQCVYEVIIGHHISHFIMSFWA